MSGQPQPPRPMVHPCWCARKIATCKFNGCKIDGLSCSEKTARLPRANMYCQACTVSDSRSLICLPSSSRRSTESKNRTLVATRMLLPSTKISNLLPRSRSIRHTATKKPSLGRSDGGGWGIGERHRLRPNFAILCTDSALDMICWDRSVYLMFCPVDGLCMLVRACCYTAVQSMMYLVYQIPHGFLWITNAQLKEK